MCPSAKKVEQMMALHLAEGPRLLLSGESRFDMRSGKSFCSVMIIQLSNHATFFHSNSRCWRYETGQLITKISVHIANAHRITSRLWNQRSSVFADPKPLS